MKGVLVCHGGRNADCDDCENRGGTSCRYSYMLVLFTLATYLMAFYNHIRSQSHLNSDYVFFLLAFEVIERHVLRVPVYVALDIITHLTFPHVNKVCLSRKTQVCILEA